MLLRLYGRRLRLARKLKSEQLDDLVQELCCYIRDHESDLRIKNPDYMAVVMRIWNMTPIRELRTCTECGHVHPADTTLRVANNGRIC
ncbi:MAG TPA: hypothetical protein VD994_11545, partial [Prosthecobacter sp.]|nr:hypothetical protein [Prosthecobacter sp.]